MSKLKRTVKLLESSLLRLDVLHNYETVLNDVMREKGVKGIIEFHEFVIESMEFVNEMTDNSIRSFNVEKYVDIYERVMMMTDLIGRMRQTQQEGKEL